VDSNKYESYKELDINAPCCMCKDSWESAGIPKLGGKASGEFYSICVRCLTMLVRQLMSVFTNDDAVLDELAMNVITQFLMRKSFESSLEELLKP
jgi:hypothetical protein